MRISHISIYLWDEHIQWCNIRLPDAENLYFMRVPEFVVMNTRTSKSKILSDSWKGFWDHSRASRETMNFSTSFFALYYQYYILLKEQR
jgi:hypothetical protein